jgi:hypothetical protein
MCLIVAKKACNMENLHRLYDALCEKVLLFGGILTGQSTAFFYSDKKGLQRLAES